MFKLKNISEIDGITCKVLLYGDISEMWGTIRPSEFVRELDQATRMYRKCNINMNCIGGDVMDGIAVRSAIMNSPLEIDMYIDGMAASMGFVIAMSCRKVYMNKYARLMAHRVSGGVCGTPDEMKQAAEQALALENDLVEIIAKRCEKTTDEVRSLWFDGADHWLTAQDALELKLIDGIYDGPKVELPEGDQNVSTLYNVFKNHLNIKEMKWENYCKKAGLKNEATEQEAIDHLDAVEKKANDAEAKAAKLQQENDQLKAAQTEADKKAKEKEEAEVLEVVENAVKDGRIQAAQKEQFVAILKADKTNGLAIINTLPKPKRLANELGNVAKGDDRSSWTFQDWQKKDGKGLMSMKNEQPDVYKALREAGFK